MIYYNMGYYSNNILKQFPNYSNLSIYLNKQTYKIKQKIMKNPFSQQSNYSFTRQYNRILRQKRSTSQTSTYNLAPRYLAQIPAHTHSYKNQQKFTESPKTQTKHLKCYQYTYQCLRRSQEDPGQAFQSNFQYGLENPNKNWKNSYDTYTGLSSSNTRREGGRVGYFDLRDGRQSRTDYRSLSVDKYSQFQEHLDAYKYINNQNNSNSVVSIDDNDDENASANVKQDYNLKRQGKAVRIHVDVEGNKKGSIDNKGGRERRGSKDRGVMDQDVQDEIIIDQEQECQQQRNRRQRGDGKIDGQSSSRQVNYNYKFAKPSNKLQSSNTILNNITNNITNNNNKKQNNLHQNDNNQIPTTATTSKPASKPTSITKYPSIIGTMISIKPTNSNSNNSQNKTRKDQYGSFVDNDYINGVSDAVMQTPTQTCTEMDQDADTESVENKFVNMHINMKKKPKNKGSKIKRILKKQCSIFYHIENSDMENIDDIKEDDNECNNDSDGGGARGKQKEKEKGKNDDGGKYNQEMMNRYFSTKQTKQGNSNKNFRKDSRPRQKQTQAYRKPSQRIFKNTPKPITTAPFNNNPNTPNPSTTIPYTICLNQKIFYYNSNYQIRNRNKSKNIHNSNSSSNMNSWNQVGSSTRNSNNENGSSRSSRKNSYFMGNTKRVQGNGLQYTDKDDQQRHKNNNNCKQTPTYTYSQLQQGQLQNNCMSNRNQKLKHYR